MKNILLLFASLIFIFVLTLLADLIVGRVLPEHQDLIFESGTTTVFETPEFSYAAKINSLGFRDYEVKAERSDKFRVMTLGDSFTFGSGVSLEHIWTKVLESDLSGQGCEFEAYNLGRGGRAVDGYAVIAEKAIPVLKPDLVLVAVLQGDDLGQSLVKAAHEKRKKRKKSKSQKNKAENQGREQEASLVEYVLPNLVELRRRISPDTIEMRPIWKSLAAEVEAGFKVKHQQRFEAIPIEMKEMFRSGGLNPGLVSLAIKKPEHLSWTLRLEEPIVQDAVAHLADNLAKIRRAAEVANAEVLVLSMPNGAYTSPQNAENYKAMGFLVEDDFLSKNGMDLAIKTAAEKNGLQHFQFTEAFRREASQGELFFPFDGHITEKGHKLFANQVATVLKSRFPTCPTKSF